MYKLIALDMDGTLLNENKEISKENKAAIKAAREKGVKVVLATGRPLKGVERFISELDLDKGEEYTTVYNGALVQNNKTKEVLSKTPLSMEIYKELYELSNALGVHIHALTEDEVITPISNPYTDIEATINGIPQKEISVSKMDMDTPIIKVMMVDSKENLDRIIPQIPEEIKNRFTIVRSADIFLEFLHKSVNKGAGIEQIATALGIKAEEVICVGDAGNDLHMIEYAGLGVAMDNAFPDIKEKADFITLNNNDHGVAHVIKKFILDEKTA